MPDNGRQIVMFTHQDVQVWSELTLILWASGLQVISAWNIATETESGGLKDGNYVKGTVLLILQKRRESQQTVYLDEIQPQIKQEVIAQIDSMRKLDDQDEPNFQDPDYILAAYAASLKVLTSYPKIGEIDIEYELSKERKKADKSKVTLIIERAVSIAYECLIPIAFDNFLWKSLSFEERFFIKGLELEKNGVYQLSAYQELARGFGFHDYTELLFSTKANAVRLKTSEELALKQISKEGFGATTLRVLLAALYQCEKEQDVSAGKSWLRSELDNYWNERQKIIELLKQFSSLESFSNLSHWHKASAYAKLLQQLVIQDGV
jgi:hypothetical protein